jgi:NADH-quinone oxidoreductase subunit G
MTGSQMTGQVEFVNLTIDGKPVRAPKGTNLIEAAKLAGVDIPFYCYHPHLSIAGNCRMCQVEVKGRPKLEIGCNTMVAEGMEVLTQNTSKKSADSQAATLEFILINHPLDCTVCDQAGHCKLQDYHYDHNARPSRFIEDKEHKVKAEPLGPTVMLDGERCIMCTRCIRFCDEVTGTSELGMLNRGDRSVIAIKKDRPLENPLSGTVVDLCPVGALTHREWRFNTRIWFSKETNSICPGCSTGCNVKVAERDGEIVQVKARLNSAVNKEWLCDEGRYGFERFLPKARVTAPLFNGKEIVLAEALKFASGLKGQEALVLASPTLLLEEFALLKTLLERAMKGAVAVAYRERALTDVEKILISPDYAANFRGAQFAGLVGEGIEAEYRGALDKLRAGGVRNLILVGDWSFVPGDLDATLLQAIARVPFSLGFLTDANSPLVPNMKMVLPARSVLEKSGLLVNRAQRLQYSQAVINAPDGTEAEWRLFHRWAEALGAKLSDAPITGATNDRDITLRFLAGEKRLQGLTIAAIKAGGVDLTSYGGGSAIRSGTVESAGAPL